MKQYFLVFYFGCIILVVPIVLMNLVTAVIVNSALEQAGQDKEAMAVRESQNRRKMVRELRRIFLNLDTDGSGKVSVDELQGISPGDKAQLTSLTNMSDPTDIFRALDVDNSGELDVE